MNNNRTMSDAPHWLSAFPRLEAITDPGWMAAVNSAKEIIVPAGMQVVREQQPCRDFLLIYSGSVRIYRVAESGREIMLYHTHGGDLCILTLGTLLEGIDYFANAVTEDEVRAVMIPAAQFHVAMAESSAFRSYILSELSRRLRELVRFVEQVAFEPLELRLACLLGQLFAQTTTPYLEITHEELARRLGSTRVVTSRLLKDFERMGCISLQRGRIELLSSEALAQLGDK